METDARPEMASLDNTVTVAPALVCQLPLCAPEVLLVMTGITRIEIERDTSRSTR